MADLDALDTSCDMSAALVDADLETVAGSGLAQETLRVARATAGALATSAGVLTRQWYPAGRGCDMLLDGIDHLEAACASQAKKGPAPSERRPRRWKRRYRNNVK